MAVRGVKPSTTYSSSSPIPILRDTYIQTSMLTPLVHAYCLLSPKHGRTLPQCTHFTLLSQSIKRPFASEPQTATVTSITSYYNLCTYLMGTSNLHPRSYHNYQHTTVPTCVNVIHPHNLISTSPSFTHTRPPTCYKHFQDPCVLHKLPMHATSEHPFFSNEVKQKETHSLLPFRGSGGVRWIAKTLCVYFALSISLCMSISVSKSYPSTDYLYHTILTFPIYTASFPPCCNYGFCT